jgi:DNA polymerase-4
MAASVRTILHVDLDAFFAAVEQRDRPELRGKPVIVGGGGPNDRGVVSTASYEARRFGVRSAMPLRTAAALCPDGIFVPVDGRKYTAESKVVLRIMRRFTPLVEPVSIDEAFLDVTASAALFGSGREIGVAIKRSIVEETQLTASVGVAPSKLVAKIASDLRKPDGLVVVEPGEEQAFLAPLPISRLWGIGERTAAALREYGIMTLGDLQRTPEDLLVRGMGPHAATLRARALGVDEAPVSDGSAAKSISHEHTFDVDTRDHEVIEKTLLAMADGVASRLRKSGLMAGTVHVKVRDSRFNTVTRQKSLPEPTDLTEPIWHAALDLARPEVRGKLIRLLGVGTSNFDRPSQIGLFAEEDERRRRAIVASDRLRKRFGDRIVVRARLLDRGLPAPFERDVMRPVDRGTLESMGREDEGREPVELVPVDEEVRFTEDVAVEGEDRG